MKKNLLSIPALAAMLLLGGMSFTQVSCSQADNKEAAQNTDQAYTDFQTFVTNTEASAGTVANQTETEWNDETAQLKSDYEAKMTAAEADAANWDEARKAEYEQLKTRYNTAYAARQAAWDSRAGASASSSGAGSAPAKLGQYYKPSQPAAALTAANARATYESFTAMVKQNENRYDIDDWRNINAEWRALDEKYDQIKDQVSTADKAEIAKEKLKYAAFKSYDKAEARASQGAAAVSGAASSAEAGTRDERQEVKTAASNTASDVKEAGKTVGQKIGNAAQKVGEKTKEGYKEVKSEVKNTDND
ncbi:hypothetical protein LJY25_02225 [Hymenobacter sp. BT175]|uniref:DUF6565 domain-containing protein n=1 Tax=Hymenobacter translucens TaxID=2886507 RepID=UPI001D0F143F|nr:DUF6565 domain-containing protein [Hymenobacter translucens]MCC2545247.1 hypothetical protein [Hymenobacter translucens]